MNTSPCVSPGGPVPEGPGIKTPDGRTFAKEERPSGGMCTREPGGSGEDYFFSASYSPRMFLTAMRPPVTAKDEAVPSPTFRS